MRAAQTREKIKRLIPKRVRYLRWQLLGLAKSMQRKALSIWSAHAAVGLLSIPSLYKAFWRAKSRPGLITKLRVGAIDSSIWIRSGTSDFDVFLQVLVKRHYECLSLLDVRRVFDAGGNIGLTSLFLMRKYPECHIVFVEPDPENFAIAKRNLAPFPGRCTLFQAAIWNESAQLAIRQGEFRDGRHWATQVATPMGASALMVTAYTVPEIMKQMNWDALDILKIDIEGAEDQVFENGAPFMRNVRCCAIELHSDRGRSVFLKAVKPFGMSIQESGELTIATGAADANNLGLDSQVACDKLLT